MGGSDRIADFSARADKIHIDWAGGRSAVGLNNFVYGPKPWTPMIGVSTTNLPERFTSTQTERAISPRSFLRRLSRALG